MWTGVTLGAPAPTEVTAALRVGHHHTVPWLAADQALVNLQETHVLVGCSAVCNAKQTPQDKMLNSDAHLNKLMERGY